MSIYYNEHDPFLVQWLKKLMQMALIAPGDIDQRSITSVHFDDLKGYTQCHFFAGIGGWSEALWLAGWDEKRPIWTGSCPCQPFSRAGAQNGIFDERHLWPAWFRLIRKCKPAVVVGEQVTEAIAFGWLDEVAFDLENEGYEFAAAVLPACSVGAPHQRDRLFFVADTGGADAERWTEVRGRIEVEAEMGRPWAYANWQGGEVGTSVLDDGISSVLAKRIASGFGNAIVPQVAAQFLKAYAEARP